MQDDSQTKITQSIRTDDLSVEREGVSTNVDAV